jgi:hypothetical protein
VQIQPAHVDQVRRGVHGRLVEISADVGGVADELRKIDPGLKVRFAEAADPPIWVVYHESEDRRTTHLVTTAQAYQGQTGVWMGLDQRIVDRIRKISSSDYDYAKELERQQKQKKAEHRAKFEEQVSDKTAEAYWKIRRFEGVKDRAFFRGV